MGHSTNWSINEVPTSVPHSYLVLTESQKALAQKPYTEGEKWNGLHYKADTPGLKSKEKESGGLYFFIENRTLLFDLNRTVLNSLEGGSPSPDQRPSS